MLCDEDTAAVLLNIAEVKDPAVSASQIKGENIRLFGAELIIDDSIPGNAIIGLDRRFAIQEIYETGVLTESERLIRRQIEGTAISEIAGFAKVITAASKILNLVWN